MRGAPKRCATAGPRRWSAPATPARRWPPRCCGFGRIKGVHRPAIAVPIPVLGDDRSQLLVDGGATVDPEPEWLVEWAELGARVRARAARRRRTDDRRCSRTARKPGKGDALRKSASPLLARREGIRRQRRGPRPHARRAPTSIVTDGFTGNVALKTLEGAMMGLAGLVFGVVDEPERRGPTADALKLRAARSGRAAAPRQHRRRACCSASTACASSRTARRRRPRS